MSFLDRVQDLPHLGLGVSTEYGAGYGQNALDVEALARHHPQYARFLEIGIEIDSGLDTHAEQWIAAGRSTTYHFLDVNLDEPEDLDRQWLADVRELADRARPAWLCGDAGMWHFGGREPGHMLLLPPVLCDDDASVLADGVRHLREETGLEVLPENPPGVIYLGDLHVLEFFARVCQRADTGMLLDGAHLAIYQRLHGHDALTGLDGFPLERVVELHVAGGTPREVDGFRWINDDHTTGVLDQTWRILEHVVPRCPHLKAIVFECERNAIPDTLPGFARIASIWKEHDTERAAPASPAAPAAPASPATPAAPASPATPAASAAPATSGASVPVNPTPSRASNLQRVMVRMLMDLRFAERVLSAPGDALGDLPLPESATDWLRRPDPRAWRADLERPGRSRRVLLHEFAASLALIAEATGELEVCDRFFHSRELHDCVQSRGSLGLTFGAFLQNWARSGPDRRVLPLARLETEFATLRRLAPGRGPETPTAVPTAPGAHDVDDWAVVPPRHVRLSPDRRLLETASGTAALHAEIVARLDETGSSRVDSVITPPTLPSRTLEFGIPEFLLLELLRPEAARSSWLVGAAEISEPLYALLQSAQERCSWVDLEREAGLLGGVDSAREALWGLLANGMLVPVNSMAHSSLPCPSPE